MANPFIPIIKAVAADDVGAYADFSTVSRIGAVYILNLGPDTVYIAYDAMPSASFGDGRLQLGANASINLDQIDVIKVGCKCAAGETANVQVVGLPRPGSTSIGVAG